jgi:hypothetical protein
MKCEVCNETELEGELELIATPTSSDTLKEEVNITSFMASARRNHIICDSCHRAVCHNCCSHAKSGYCDHCIEKYNLHDLVGEIKRERL